MKNGDENNIEKKYPEYKPVPVGKKYGKFNGDLELYGDAEVIKEFGMSFEEMSENYRTGVGLFELPPNWLPKDGEENGTARWRTENSTYGKCYYYDRG